MFVPVVFKAWDPIEGPFPTFLLIVTTTLLPVQEEGFEWILKLTWWEFLPSDDPNIYSKWFFITLYWNLNIRILCEVWLWLLILAEYGVRRWRKARQFLLPGLSQIYLPLCRRLQLRVFGRRRSQNFRSSLSHSPSGTTLTSWMACRQRYVRGMFDEGADNMNFIAMNGPRMSSSLIFISMIHITKA